MSNIRNTLEKLGPFTELKAAHLDFLAKIGKIEHYAASQSMCEEAQPADKFFLLVDGRVEVEIYDDPQGAITIDTLTPGDVLGWSWIISPHHWRFFGRTVGPVEVLSFPADAIREKCEADYEFGYRLHRIFNYILAQRLEGARIQLLGDN